MGIANISNTGYTGLNAAKTAIATAGHNVTNTNTEGFSRQRVHTETTESRGGIAGKGLIGTGTRVSRVERVNDEYIEKQVRNGQRELSHYEEKDVAFKQIEDIFNEMNGDGLNRLISRFFNDFRKLANEPENPAIRQSIRESALSMINDFKRIRKDTDEVRRHMDAKLEGYAREVNGLSGQIADLNKKINEIQVIGGPANDLLDKRDLAIRKLGAYAEITTHQDRIGNVNVELRNFGPLVTGNRFETLSVERTPADDQGKLEGSFDLMTTGSTGGPITHLIKGGKIGALLEARDHSVTQILQRLDQLAYQMSEAVNQVHTQGHAPNGSQGINFFATLSGKEGAAEKLSLSEEIMASPDHIATAAIPDAPGDNRIALAISKLQAEKVAGDGQATFDEFYNSMVTEVGVATSQNRSSMNQQKDIMNQLSKIREQISGVSIDEETANLLQFQHAFEASAKVIQIADELMKTVLSLKRD